MPPTEALSRAQLEALFRQTWQTSHALEAENRDLTEQVAFLRKTLYAPSTERTRTGVDAGQQTLFNAPVTTEAVVPAAPVESETITYERKKGHGRAPVARDLPVVDHIIPVPEAERVCADGSALMLTGYETSERLHLVPEQLVRLVIKRERWGLPDTRESIVIAPPLRALVAKGKATDAFIHEIIVRKFAMGLPLYRQMQDLNRRGADVSDSFLGDCVRNAAAVYAPVHAALRAQVLANTLVYADETPIRQLGGADGARTGYLWAWLGGAQAYFHYAPTRAQSEVRTVLGIADDGSWEKGTLIGFVMCDGYAGYNPAFAERPPPLTYVADASTDAAADEVSAQSAPAPPPRAVRLACWAHVRRKFRDCIHDQNALQVARLVDDLFRVEREARKTIEKRSLDEVAAAQLRLDLRRERSAPIVAAIATLMAQLRPIYEPTRATARAIAYATELWPALIVYLDRGDLPMDNNTAERAIRPLVVGRKNYLFVGSEDGGQWAACFYSLIESCRMQGIDPRRYFAHVTPLLIADQPTDPASLTPLALRTTLHRR